MPDLRIGDRVTFIPAAFTDLHGPKAVRGVVVYINEPHRFYQVTYTIGNAVLGEGFKFEGK